MLAAMKNPEKPKPTLEDLGLDGPLKSKVLTPILPPVLDENRIPLETAEYRVNAQEVPPVSRWPAWMRNVWVQNVFWLGVMGIFVYWQFDSLMHSGDWQQSLFESVAVIGGMTLAVAAIGFLLHVVSAAALRSESAALDAIQQIRDLIPALREDPLNATIHARLRSMSFKVPSASKDAYNASLLAVEPSGGVPAAKTLALAIGRIHYGSLRPNGIVTVYDENAILNDISARV